MNKINKKHVIKYIKEINNKYQEKNRKLIKSGEIKGEDKFYAWKNAATIDGVINWLCEEIENDEELAP